MESMTTWLSRVCIATIWSADRAPPKKRMRATSPRHRCSWFFVRYWLPMQPTGQVTAKSSSPTFSHSVPPSITNVVLCRLEQMVSLGPAQYTNTLVGEQTRLEATTTTQRTGANLVGTPSSG